MDEKRTAAREAQKKKIAGRYMEIITERAAVGGLPILGNVKPTGLAAFDLTPKENEERDVKEYIELKKMDGIYGKQLDAMVTAYKKRKGYT